MLRKNNYQLIWNTWRNYLSTIGGEKNNTSRLKDTRIYHQQILTKGDSQQRASSSSNTKWKGTDAERNGEQRLM